MSTPIEAEAPARWHDLEARVARILRECGYDVENQKRVELAGRGAANIDVWARDHSSPPNVIVVECKLWKRRASQTLVHSFRTVVGDSGANTGLLVSSSGFQAGAIDAAKYSNVRLVDWRGFQDTFVERWYRTYMAPHLIRQVGPLIEYTEPFNSRVARKAETLTVERRDQLKALRDRYSGVALGLIPLYVDVAGLTDAPTVPHLPLRESATDDRSRLFPDSVLDAPALRILLEELTVAFTTAIAAFDGLFGERA
jgi:restriction system protein